ncbi:hypothetical protein SZ64_14610 [Erythrobacter sp. SG61-1L]|uniref:tetratricopeptide repeat protein n=1 Tax=Erythrobacter sp. SG61-1L TaxID=1603897 RepID=UPI0006C90ACF|nr:hypothetical protein [Erythrobacter sp. SG61-1L]KPL69226.1 hypothetical protein SZ64_14610 [Erythrobacter sp. SG61-1L]
MGASGPAVRLLLSALPLGCLIAAWGSGLDRASADSPGLERLVPGPLRAQADRSAGAMALVRGDLPGALAHAEDAVRRDPAEALGNSLLGTARVMTGDTQGSEAAFRVSAERGWRDRLTQLYWFDAAMRADDVERAALRADALLRADPVLPAADDLLTPLEASPQGRAALAARLAQKPGWSAAYFRPRNDPDPAMLQHRTQVALAVAALGTPLECGMIGDFSAMLIGNGMRREAEQLRRASCPGSGPGAGDGILADGGFGQLARKQDGGPFGWSRFTSGDLAVEVTEQAKGDYAVKARNSASVTRLILSQAIDLPPGAWRVKANAKAEPGSLVASLDCDGRARRPAQVDGELTGAGQLLKAETCDRAVLGVWLRPGEGEAVIDDIAITRVN